MQLERPKADNLPKRRQSYRPRKRSSPESEGRLRRETMQGRPRGGETEGGVKKARFGVLYETERWKQRAKGKKKGQGASA
ncbi:hypothetical protein GW17_00058290 [Ensete ventricosum]|nr:hypothetical protein GW17_00058290 [Ensete ventricosum]